MASPSSKRRGVPIIRYEPEGASLLDAYPMCNQVLRAGGWYEYCRSLAGHHTKVSKAFSQSFDGEKAEFKSLMLQVMEQSIAEATKFLVEGDKWFKKHH